MGNALAKEDLMSWVVLLFNGTENSDKRAAFSIFLPPEEKQLSQEGTCAVSNL